jgi:hypothetical protein
MTWNLISWARLFVDHNWRLDSYSSVGKANQNVSVSKKGLASSRTFCLAFFCSVLAATFLMLWRHIRPDTFNLHVYHGQNRRGIEHLQQCDVVITTFQTLSSVWRKQNLQNLKTQSSRLYGIELSSMKVRNVQMLLNEANFTQLMPFKMPGVSLPKHAVLSRLRGSGQ